MHKTVKYININKQKYNCFIKLNIYIYNINILISNFLTFLIYQGTKEASTKIYINLLKLVEHILINLNYIIIKNQYNITYTKYKRIKETQAQ